MEYPVQSEILGDPPLKLDGDDPRDLYIIASPSVADRWPETKNNHHSKTKQAREKRTLLF